jgi:branched-chain amino acid aminotransferase
LQEFDGEEFYKCLKDLVVLDKECIPRTRGESLYLRPTYIGTTVRK